ncbi:unnamed protein product, partial [Protopolystoma xenopodis]
MSFGQFTRTDRAFDLLALGDDPTGYFALIHLADCHLRDPPCVHPLCLGPLHSTLLHSTPLQSTLLLPLPIHPLDDETAAIHTVTCTSPLRRLLRKQRQYECSSKANRQLVKRNQASSSGGTELRISSRNTFTRNGSKLNNWAFSGPFFCNVDGYSLHVDENVCRGDEKRTDYLRDTSHSRRSHSFLYGLSGFIPSRCRLCGAHDVGQDEHGNLSVTA